MKEKLKKVYPTILSIIIILFILWFLSSCEKDHHKNLCVNAFETFQDTDYFVEYYYERCKKIYNNDEEVDRCMDEMRLSSKEIKNYCDDYMNMNDSYDEYKEY